MNKDNDNSALLNYLSQYVSEHKKRRIDEVLDLRTRKLTVVLEDIYKPHNASAVLRTSECYGIQDIHIVEQQHQYDVNPYVTRGAAKWLSLHRYNDPEAQNIKTCFAHLRSNGFRIVATGIGTKSSSMEEISLDEKIALVFGTEHSGVSQYVQEAADDFVEIPMMGFTDSYNISVSAAILFQTLVPKLRSQNEHWKLSSAEKEILRLEWYQMIVKNAEIHINQFNKEQATERG